ncbi:cupredoxin domain-containing protein [Catenulispora sp. NL8]|uniref:Cupredoxin domain-containing protein n=1 Tax=Catenulispora pinistramenti TaxID=2705254 RepID=A0ABS5KRK7_9ACTN|nr:cupredoxin domain-containing protein [Catenulispora pinistramenti]MBS2548686.1 cupredoxin domain-containing protein [Catenulispora pinistramenti]
MLRFPGKTAAATLLAAATALTMTACSGTSSHPAAAPTSTPSTPSSSSGSGTAGTPVSASQIVIANFAFSPTDLSVAPGQTVTVVNNDSTTHTLTATTGKAFDTGDIAPGKTATFTAPTTPGTYSYICTIHQFMHGTLIVK